MIIEGGVRRRDRRIWYVVLGVFVMVFLFTFLTGRFKSDEEVGAANASKFDAGYIISDYQMSNYNSMSEAEIQAFLTKKNPCGNTNYGDYAFLSERYPNMKWHFENGHFVCLSEERFGEGVSVGEGETAAHIIYQAAQDYRINPQVLIVLLEKEQGLITDTFPNSVQYRSATGYGCPDTAACDTEYYGFRNQVRHAAALFRTVLDGGWTNYPLGNNYIQYNPNAACGGSVVNIRNLATSALYRYTPYQPNAGALAAGYGQAYCGAYGNRNFYLYFEDWFGNITVEREWQKMMAPRVMKVQKETMNIDPMENRIYEDQPAILGNKYYFTSKVDVVWGGKQEVCLRTYVDTINNVDRCIIMSRMGDEGSLYDVEEIEPKKFNVLRDTNKYDLKTGEKVQEIKTESYPKIKFVAKTIYNGKVYYQTEHDSANGLEYFIPGEDVEAIVFKDFMYPRNMKTMESVEYVDLETGNSCKKVNAGHIVKFVSKVEDNEGLVYYRDEVDAENMSACVIKASDVYELEGWENVTAADGIEFKDFLYPRELSFKQGFYSVDVTTGKSCEYYYDAQEKIKFTTKIDIDGLTFFRSENEDAAGLPCAVPSKILSEI